jgi:hypothetical protein
MNANETAPKSDNSRLKRIQKVSRILKFCVLFCFFAPLVIIVFNLKGIHLAKGTIAIFNHAYASTENIPNVMFVLSGTGYLAFLLGACSFIRLLSSYEKGVIFGAANISELKIMSRCLASYGLLSVVANVIYAGGIVFPLVLLDGFACPWIVVGGAIYIVAWIMDEGRKIQEEQELTV